jgi:hypothetical protein
MAYLARAQKNACRSPHWVDTSTLSGACTNLDAMCPGILGRAYDWRPTE